MLSLDTSYTDTIPLYNCSDTIDTSRALAAFTNNIIHPPSSNAVDITLYNMLSSW